MKSSLIKPFDVGGIRADVGSDWHFPLKERGIIGKIIDTIRRDQQGEVLFCMGDLFDAAKGEDSSPAINEVLNALANSYEQVIFTPGNHDLRGRENPWESFDLSPHVICPDGEEPIIHRIGDTHVLIADLFYDMDFVINPSELGLSRESILKHYASSNDGRYFLNGDVSSFPAMRERAARALTRDIDVVATHTLPHPSLAAFRVEEMTDRFRELQRELSLEFICKPEEDVAKGKQIGKSPEECRRLWNTKAFYMGSNVLGDSQAEFKDGLFIVYGHHHTNDEGSRIIREKKVHLVTYQNPVYK